MCRLSHSRRKGHCHTPKRRCLDWWCNVPFFCGYAKRYFYGFSDGFSFLLSICTGSGKVVECISLPHEWNKRPYTVGQISKNDSCRPAKQASSERKHSYFLYGTEQHLFGFHNRRLTSSKNSDSPLPLENILLLYSPPHNRTFDVSE